MKVKCTWCDAVLDENELIYVPALNTTFCPHCYMGDSCIEVERYDYNL